jgi:hypothetical protein
MALTLASSALDHDAERENAVHKSRFNREQQCAYSFLSLSLLWMESNSTSKISVEPGPICPAPRSP